MKEIKMRPLTGTEDRISIGAFKQAVTHNFLADYDGYGEWATNDAVSDVEIRPSKLTAEYVPTWATQIVWYNR